MGNPGWSMPPQHRGLYDGESWALTHEMGEIIGHHGEIEVIDRWGKADDFERIAFRYKDEHGIQHWDVVYYSDLRRVSAADRLWRLIMEHNKAMTRLITK